MQSYGWLKFLLNNFAGLTMKNNNHSTEKLSAAKLRKYEDVYDFKTFRFIPYSEEKIKEIGLELIKLAQDEEKEFLILTQIYTELGLGSETITKWKKKYPFFKSCNNQAKTLIADRRVVGAFKRKYDSASTRGPFGHFNHPLFIEEWKESHEYLNDLKIKLVTAKDDDGSDGGKTIFVEHNMFTQGS